MEGCPGDDVLGAFISGELPADQAAEIEAHVGDCAACAHVIGMAASGPRRPATEPALEAGQLLDRYHLLGVAGRGAVGQVYAAYDPKLDRKVALKVLRRAGTELEERLHREARAMARVHSPHVVAVHDTGAVGDVLYVAMELVEGRTLTAWLAEERSPADVLAAFRQAGQGLRAAHAAGVVHRDFKPDNVLVRTDGTVAVTDFGLAVVASAPVEATPGPPPEDLQLTATGGLIGTPAYMAPEQLGGGRGDARSDLFSFCVSLYAALYGRHPFPTSSFRALRDHVMRGEVAAPRAPGVPGRVRDAVLAGLRPRPEDRPSLEALLAALGPSQTRRTLLVGAALAVPVMAVAALAGARQPATRPCAGAARLLDGVWDDARRVDVRRGLLATGSPIAAEAAVSVERALDGYASRWIAGRTEACEATRVRGEQSERLLDQRVACLDELRVKLGALVRSFEHAAGRDEVAAAPVAAYGLPALDRCAALRELDETAVPETPAYGPLITLAQASAAHARALGDLGNAPAALRELAPALSVATSTAYRPLEAEVLLLDGELRGPTDAAAGAKSWHAAVLAAQAGGRYDLAARAWTALVRQKADQAANEDATQLADYARATLERHPDALVRAELLTASAFIDARNQPDRSVALHREALIAYEAELGPDHPRVAEALGVLGSALSSAGKANEAIPLLSRAIDLGERTLGREHPVALRLRARLGSLLREVGRQGEAMPMLLEVLAAQERILGPDHPATGETLNSIGVVRFDQAEFRESAAALRRAIAIAERQRGKAAVALSGRLSFLSQVLVRFEPFEVADDVARQAVAAAERAPEPRAMALFEALQARGYLLLRADHCQEAIPLLERAHATGDAAGLMATSRAAYSLDSLGQCLHKVGRPGDAVAVLQRALALRERTLGPRHFLLSVSLVCLSRSYRALGEHAKAVEVARRAISILFENRQPPAHLGQAHFVLAQALWATDRQASRRTLAQAFAWMASSTRITLWADMKKWAAKPG